MSASESRVAPGAYKFTVRSTAEAVALVHARFGPAARVLSVRAIEATGLTRFFRAPRLEVVVQVDPPVAARGDAADGSAHVAAAESASSTGLRLGSETPWSPSPAEPASARANRVAQLPTPPDLNGILRRSGLTEATLTRLQTGEKWRELDALPLHRALAETSRLLRRHAESRPGRPPLSRAAFLGAPGVGRTTALCKWLSGEVFRRARLGHVVTVEFERPNPLGPLPVFTEALGVPLAHFPCETQPALLGSFVYLDVPGLSARRPLDNAPLAAFLDREAIRERVLVLNAAYERAALRDAYAAGRDLGATHLVFTHLDEVPQWGKLWDYLFDEEVEPLFLSTGPSLTGDCEEDVTGAIMRRTLPVEN